MKQKSTHLPGQIADVDLRLLRVFKSVVECGGMAGAELELNVGMPTISRQIKDLEERLGLVLCRRGRAGFALTAEGSELYAAALQLLSATTDFRTRLEEIHDRIGGELHLAVFEKTVSNPASRISQALERFHRAAPDVSLNIHVSGIEAIEQGVLNGQFQLGIVPEHRHSASLAYQPLFSEPMHLYAAPGHPWFSSTKRWSWADLRRQPLAALGYQSPNMRLMHRRQLVRQATASDQEGVALLILTGCFVGFLPGHYARPFVEDGRLRAVSEGLLGYDCRFVRLHRNDPPPSRAARMLIELLDVAHG
ncbi:LysR family transcriptional regulator [Roseateles chitosanitabidus]|uniref:LysR family transcriptional regulator n=1 Tax=Roseateles chitosanitabidus TaxID=65048 RepID=UPI00082B2FBF|nr:LysR family transcriptional regulator [Roseateles chitosanitabidus]